ncbi:MAG: 1,4-dihydroxy-2-naphthoate polyprenyltransferase [Ilumatobacteraceae bacterium]|nr:1,4-dihydroxy-2-naphthoate polyprenyltransferase [Ilumatobacteraceae bacterium]
MSGAPSLRIWIAGARPRTLPAAVVPVAVGAAVAVDGKGWSSVSWAGVVLALVVSLLLQVGVNYANDYSDGVRGTDDVRVGPLRLVASGSATPQQVRAAAIMSLLLASVAGLVLAAMTSWWLIAVGVAAVLAAWGYTGGPKPYGYLGLGEVFVFVFFGLVATVGTTFAAVEQLLWRSWVAGVGVGALACALLVVNNLRDLPTDRDVNKRTLAVRLGDARTRVMFTTLVVVALASSVAIADLGALIALAVAVPALTVVRTIHSGVVGAELIPVLGSTGKLQLLFGVLLSVGLVIV